MSLSVFGSDEQSDLAVDVVRWVGLAELVVTEEKVPGTAELSLLFVDRDTIAELNERFLGGTGPTDVLAFPMDDDLVMPGRQPDQGGRGPGAPAEGGEPPTLIGDVVVCPAVAAEQAPRHGATVDDELALLVVHGVLHLLNYDHADPKGEAAMQQRERELLGRFHGRSIADSAPAGPARATDDRTEES
ncbi:MAG: rRNA maturation RNase YbeY [Acidimicrobiia bacterium]